MKKILLFSLLFFIGINYVYASTDTAYSYVLMDEVTGRVLKGKNIDSPKLIASITKIMTCILAIEANKLDDVVVVNESVLSSYGSGIYISVGEEIKLIDLLYGLMLRSGNDAALMIADYVGGDVDNFVLMMNKKAKELGIEYIDTGAMYRAMAVHFKDLSINPEKDFAQEMAEVGEGNLDWNAIISACQKAGTKWALVEQDICRRDPFESLRISYEYLREKGFE